MNIDVVPPMRIDTDGGLVIEFVKALRRLRSEERAGRLRSERSRSDGQEQGAGQGQNANQADQNDHPSTRCRSGCVVLFRTAGIAGDVSSR